MMLLIRKRISYLILTNNVMYYAKTETLHNIDPVETISSVSLIKRAPDTFSKVKKIARIFIEVRFPYIKITVDTIF